MKNWYWWPRLNLIQKIQQTNLENYINTVYHIFVIGLGVFFNGINFQLKANFSSKFDYVQYFGLWQDTPPPQFSLIINVHIFLKDKRRCVYVQLLARLDSSLHITVG